MSNLLYKYLDVNGAIMMLDYSNLMYANATMFNDPFDCHPSLIDFSNVPIESRRGWPADVIVSQPLEICERVSEYGCVEKYFSKPNWSVNYADIIQMREPQQLGLVADVEVKYNE